MADDVMNTQKGESLVKSWLKDINDALKREKKYRKLGQDCVKLYEGKEPENTPFSILYSNTETLMPAVYNSVPIPMVDRRYKDADPVGKAVAEVSTRTLKYLIQTESKDYDAFDDLIQAAVLEVLTTNRGVTRFRYVAREDGYGECVYGESVRWDKFFHGYARTWKKVPWIGFEWDMSKDELKKNFPKVVWEDLRKMVSNEDGDDDGTSAEDKEEMAGVKTYKVYEIWDKISEKIMFFSPASKQPLRMVDDPLELPGFFPIPRPLNFMKKVTTLVPTPLYMQYKSQAAELNELTRRLKAIIKAIKFRGAYNSTIEGIEKMLEADDNELVPLENMQAMPDNTGVDKIFYVVPVQDLAQTAQALYQQREACKQVIYEITGVSDILRGASVASETATAQNIKNQWGTLRLKRMQKEVQRYCRDALAIMLEIAAKKFELVTIKQMTGLPYFSNEEKQAVQQKINQMQQQAQMQPPPQPGAPPAQQPPQVPLEVQHMMQSPSWEDIMAVLQNGIALSYKVDIETNSTIDAEAAQDKQDIAELLNAVSQFLNGVAPLVEQGILPIEVAKQMLLVISRRFNFGAQLEDALSAMKEPEPKTDPNEQAKNAAISAKAQADAAESQAKLKQTMLEGQLAEQEFEQKKELMRLEGELAIQKLEIAKEELQIQRAGLGAKAALQAASHSQKMEALKAKPKESSSASV